MSKNAKLSKLVEKARKIFQQNSNIPMFATEIDLTRSELRQLERAGIVSSLALEIESGSIVKKFYWEQYDA